MNMLAQYGFELIRLARRFAQGNGQAERSIRTIVEEIKKRVHQTDKKWYANFDVILWANRTTRREHKGETLFLIVYGTDPLAPTKIRFRH